MGKESATHADAYWERAGQLGYAEAMYTSNQVAQHIINRMARIALEVAAEIGIPSSSDVLELGCGDGYFSNCFLADNFASVVAFDKSEAAIDRARRSSRQNVRFEAADITALELQQTSSVFLMGILHHLKTETPRLVEMLAGIAERVVVMEPNGNHVARKLLELTPSYRAAGEDSFRRRELVQIFERAGYRVQEDRRLNLFPNFTPEFVFRLCAPLEPFIERSALLNGLCTVNMFGFIRN